MRLLKDYPTDEKLRVLDRALDADRNRITNEGRRAFESGRGQSDHPHAALTAEAYWHESGWRAELEANS